MSRNRRHRSARRASAVKSACGDDAVLVAIASLVGKQVPRFVFAEHRPLEPRTIEEILEANEKRLLRSDVDALDAVEAYGDRLQMDG
jgi:hypothetical protein